MGRPRATARKGDTDRQIRCGIYAIFSVLIAIEPGASIGPMLFLLLMDAVGG